MSEKTIPEPRDLSKEKDERCFPLARKFMELLCTHAHELPLGNNMNDDERVRVYGLIYSEIMEMFKTENIRLDDVKYVGNLVTHSLNTAVTLMTSSMDKNESIATRILWKVHNMEDLTIMDLDMVLKGQELPNRMEENDPAVFNKESEDTEPADEDMSDGPKKESETDPEKISILICPEDGTSWTLNNPETPTKCPECGAKGISEDELKAKQEEEARAIATKEANE